MKDDRKCPRNPPLNQRKFEFWFITRFYPGDLVTRTRDREICGRIRESWQIWKSHFDNLIVFNS